MLDQLNHKHKIDFLLSNDTSLNRTSQIIVKSKCKKGKCSECNKTRKILNESHQICYTCCKAKAKIIQSGNKVIDEFIRYTQTNLPNRRGKIVFAPYDQFKDIEFIAEGGFSKIYKATWINGPIIYGRRKSNYEVVLKKLNNSKNITLKELNELKVFYDFSSKTTYDGAYVSDYYGITQDPITQNIMFIMPYYNEGDLAHYITNDFYNINWRTKLNKLRNISQGLKNIHSKKIIHRDLHSGNIFFDIGVYSLRDGVIGDLGLSKSATAITDEDNENYGIIPYMAPEIFQGKKYTTASDVYSFGMIMWEFMTGRRPFWDKSHNTELIIEICDGSRPPIVTNAPEGYIDLMKECWHPDPDKRPTAEKIRERIGKMYDNEHYKRIKKNPTAIVKSSDIGPVTTNNPGAIYKSRPLSNMIQSAMSLRSLNSQSTDKSISAYIDKRKFESNFNNDSDGQIIKRKLVENKNNGKY